MDDQPTCLGHYIPISVPYMLFVSSFCSFRKCFAYKSTDHTSHDYLHHFPELNRIDTNMGVDRLLLW